MNVVALEQTNTHENTFDTHTNKQSFTDLRSVLKVNPDCRTFLGFRRFSEQKVKVQLCFDEIFRTPPTQ